MASVFVLSVAGVVAGCSGSDDSASPLTAVSTPASGAPVETTSAGTASISSDAPPSESSPTESSASTYTVVAGDTLSGIAAEAGVSVDALITANEWSDGVDHLILQGDIISLPSGSSIDSNTTNDSGPPSPTAPASESVNTSGGYQTASPQLEFTNDRTSPVGEPLADGVYFAQSVSASGNDVAFGLGQLFLCTGEPIAGLPELNCTGQTTAQLNQPTAQVQLAQNATVILIYGGTGSPVNVSVTTAEYARLVNGLPPSSDAPADFRFDGDRTLVRVSGGSVDVVEQIYTS